MMSTLLLAAILFLQGVAPLRTQPGAITGRILFMDGRPAAGVRVSALAVLDAPGQRADAAIMSIAQTDSDGRYHLEGVPPGRYYIAQGRVNAPTYFPGVAALTSATIVTVGIGATLREVDFRVPPVVRVSGRVNRPDSATSGTTALLLARLPFQVRLIGGGITDLMGAVNADGLFEIQNVPPGTYQVSVQPNILGAAVPPSTIVVTDKDITGLQLGTPQVQIGGTVVLEDGPLPAFQLQFADSRPNPTVVPSGTLPFVASLKFTVNLPEGEYRVSVIGLPTGYVVKSIFAGSTDLLAQTLKMTLNDSPQVVVSLGVSSPPPWVKVSGRVIAPAAPWPAANAVSIKGTALADVLNAPVKPDGSFEFPTILPGTYQIRSVPAVGYMPKTVVVGNRDLVNIDVAPPTAKEIVGDFAKIQPGEFLMGCAPGDGECLDEEKPAHLVKITKGFEIGRYEVTQLQWQVLMGSNPSQFQGEDKPVENINDWNTVQIYLSRLNALHDGYLYRLPTEAEWEYAAHAGSRGPFFAPVDTIGRHAGNSRTLASVASFSPTHPVGEKLPNAWGLYDMHGNVWEWTSDWYADRYYDVSPLADPTGPESGPMRVMKGGSAVVAPVITRVSVRGHMPPTNASFIFGLRTVRVPIP